MNVSNELSFKQFLSRSYNTYNLSKKVDFIKPNNEIDYDQFAVSTNLLGDSIELLLKSISHLLNCNFNATHSYEDILTKMDQNKYGIQDIISRINANRFFDGKLIHEFKYADKNTTVSSKDIKRGHDQDFYRDFSIDERNDLENLYFELKDAALKAYIDLSNLSSNILYNINLIENIYNTINDNFDQICAYNKIYGKEIEADYIEMRISLQNYFNSCYIFIKNIYMIIDCEDIFEYMYYNILKEITNVGDVNSWIQENSGNIMNKINYFNFVINDFYDYTKVKFMTL